MSLKEWMSWYPSAVRTMNFYLSCVSPSPLPTSDSHVFKLSLTGLCSQSSVESLGHLVEKLSHYQKSLPITPTVSPSEPMSFLVLSISWTFLQEPLARENEQPLSLFQLENKDFFIRRIDRHPLWHCVVCFFYPGKRNKLRVYYLSWLKSKIMKGEEVWQLQLACLFQSCEVTKLLRHQRISREFIRSIIVNQKFWNRRPLHNTCGLIVDDNRPWGNLCVTILVILFFGR